MEGVVRATNSEALHAVWKVRTTAHDGPVTGDGVNHHR